jgi:hypothetical protein
VRTWSRTGGANNKHQDISSISGPDSLSEALPGTDIVICLLPLTPITNKLIDSHFLGMMRPGATLINAARGAHVVEEDLLAYLESGAFSMTCCSRSLAPVECISAQWSDELEAIADTCCSKRLRANLSLHSPCRVDWEVACML